MSLVADPATTNENRNTSQQQQQQQQQQQNHQEQPQLNRRNEIPDNPTSNENYRKRREFQPKKINNYELLFFAGEFFMYFMKFLLVYKLLEGYFKEQQRLYFVLTASFFVFPLLCIHLISCKWFFDDLPKQCCKKFFVFLLHLLLCGPALRCCSVIWYGLKYSRKRENQTLTYYKLYTKQRRDLSLLRCIRIFWTEGGQAILQLYVLLQTEHFKEDRININDFVRGVEVIWAVLSMSYALVAYQNDYRKHRDKKGYSFCAYVAHIFYRLLFIISRILAIALFVRVCHPIIVAILFLHVMLIMVCWIRYDRKGLPSFVDQDGSSYHGAFENFFYCTLGLVYVFCHLKMTSTSTNRRLVPYCILYLLQNGLMFMTWLLIEDRHYGMLETVIITCLLGFPLLGVIFHQLYYVGCHPRNSIFRGEQITSEDQVSILRKHQSTQSPPPPPPVTTSALWRGQRDDGKPGPSGLRSKQPPQNV